MNRSTTSNAGQRIATLLLGYTYSGGTTRSIANTGTGVVSGTSLQSAY